MIEVLIMAKSKKYKLNKEDGMKLMKGAGIAVAGSVVAYVAEMLPMIDFGNYDKAAMIVGMFLVNAARKYLAGK